MYKKIKNQKINPEILEEIKIKKYILVYIEELRRHFNISNKRMERIIFEVHKDFLPISRIEKFVRKLLNMIKLNKSFKSKEKNENSSIS